MKIASKILLTVLLLIGLLLPLASSRAYAMAQITMVNKSQLTLNLYIDGNFGCGPVLGLGRFTNSPGLFCTSSVTPGPHRLEARDGEKVMAREDNVNIGDGTSPTWTVTIEDPDQALIKQLDGARYILHENYLPDLTDECELTISGTTLVWRVMVSYASPAIRKQIVSGTGGFFNRTVGQWEEKDRMQIIGRKARSSTSSIIFTISEEGNSITETQPALKTTKIYRRE